MFGYSETRNIVFILRAEEIHDTVSPKMEIHAKLLRMDDMTSQQWQQLKQHQGGLRVSYLKLRFGSSNTHILLSFIENRLVHNEWIVPASKIKSRYPFVSDNSYSIISCLTAQRFRGLGIYPDQLRKVINSTISSDKYWIWTTSDNLSSLKGIRKAGGIKVGEFVRKKCLWGCISHIEYFPETGDSK